VPRPVRVGSAPAVCPFCGMHASLQSFDPSAVSDTDLLLHPNEPQRSELRRRSCILCTETMNYRKIAATHVTGTDSVLELGCSFGDATKVLVTLARRVTAVDNSDECVQRACMACKGASNCRIETSDVLANPAQCLALGREMEINVAFIDLGGNRDGDAVLPIVLLLLAELPHMSLCVVKCRALHAAASIHLAIDGGTSTSFWEAAIAANAAQRRLLALPVADEEANPQAAPGEARLCYAFLNKGRCQITCCTFRHHGPSHPDAIADKARRGQVGWQPARRRSKATPPKAPSAPSPDPSPSVTMLTSADRCFP